MNIKQAKEQIKNAIIAYSTKDQFGNHMIPVSKQRPVFLLGAPGIGKTAIMEQIANELDLALVSYSMTHHTRQSALGLPFIVEKQYGDLKYTVSEYTMSEIIASVYDAMEKTGKKEGILFLDEINCVSETLAPSMLQFLQYKTFGRHQVPEGWIVVTAGNPPEYNNSVKEFDIVTWDRLKKIVVEPDYEVWKEYAVNASIHPVVTSYLNIKPNNFYHITSTVDGKSFVTARAWEDLSQMITLYEINNLTVDYILVSQYLQDEKIAKDFSHYYQLFHKYESDYQVDSILNGTCGEEIKNRAKEAKFDERLSLITLIMSTLDDIIEKEVLLEGSLRNVLKFNKSLTCNLKDEFIEAFNHKIISIHEEMKHKEISNTLSINEQKLYFSEIHILEKLVEALKVENGEPKQLIKGLLLNEVNSLKDLDTACQSSLENVFIFFEEVFKEGQEMLILVTEITINKGISKYIYSHGCDKYYEHNKTLLFEDKQNELMDRIDAINLLTVE